MIEPIALVIGPPTHPETGATVVPASYSGPYQTCCTADIELPAPSRCYSVPTLDSGVVIPDHSAQRIAAAQAKRERKAAKRNIN